MRRLAARHSDETMAEHGSDLPEQDPSAPSVANSNGDAAPTVIDIEELITEVKKHPILYSKVQAEYLEKIERQKEWAEVCQSLFSQWSQFSPKKKREKVREVQSKWHKLKATFLKSYGGVRKLSAQGRKKKQHLESMSFLVTKSVDHDEDIGPIAFNNPTELEFSSLMDPLPPQEPPLPNINIPINMSFPSLSAQIPSLSAQIPSVSAQMPSVSAHMPSVSAEMPSVSAEMPSVSAEMPQLSAQMPQVSAQMPPISVQMPLLPAQMPPLRVQMPPLRAQMPPLRAQMPPLRAQMPPLPVQMPPLAAFEDFPNPFDFKPKPIYINVPEIPETPAKPVNPNMHFAMMLVPLLDRLNTRELFATWPKMLDLIQNAESKNKLSILQSELIYPPEASTSKSAKQRYPAPAPHQRRTVYTTTQNRPKDAEGNLIYPETDPEDYDEN